MKKIFILLASVSLLEISTLAQSGGAGAGAAGAGAAGAGTAGSAGSATGATGNSSAGVGTANSGVSTTGATVGSGNAASSPGSPGANALQVTPAQAQPQVGLGTQSGAAAGPVAISGGMSEASGAAINRSVSAGGNAVPAGTPPEPLEVSTGSLSEVPGVITLRGVVRGESEKWEIERQVRKLKGVLTVNNLLQIADKEDPRGVRHPRKGETTIRYEGLPSSAK